MRPPFSSLSETLFVIVSILQLIFAAPSQRPNPGNTSVYGDLHFRASYSDSPQRFEIDVDPEFVSYVKSKIDLTRYTRDLHISDWVEGPPKQNISSLRDYWSQEYDWFSVQKHLNANLKQFTTTVNAGPNYTHSIPLHFVHHQSHRQDAIPLLHIHDSPGSFMEIEGIIDSLTHPPNDSTPAFHVVAPDIPGFGFSPAPAFPGLGLREAGQGFNHLMSQLGYNRYVIGGGDFGALTLRHMATDFPESVASVLSNFYLVYPNATDLARQARNETSPIENANIAIANSITTTDGYAAIQETTPLQLSVAMTDSPIGTAAWIWEVMYQATPGFIWPLSDVITWTMMYYIQGPYGAFRMYKEAATEGSFTNDFPYIHQPVGIIEFPGDLPYYTPLARCQRSANVTYFNREFTFGGHYPATEAPMQLIEAYREFWGNTTLSGELFK
ncbi:hypothetical protein LTR86_010815 [Recurvomyces mirabilis]|nr:hypothetical protein LTR86_010815 [Recurvomyces mirabilis]